LSEAVDLPGAHVAWILGGHARLVALAGDAVTLVSTVPSPPGSRPEGKLLGEGGGAVRMKVHGCRAEGDGTFRLEGRLLDATRALRGVLAALTSPGSGSTSPAKPA
jgi:hypothetical protein